MANQITITGALGRAPALNFTQSQKPVWGFPLGYTPSRKTDNGFEDTGPTLWFDVAVWGDDAEALARIYDGVEKGRATVTGRIASRTWTNREGVEVTQMTITADAVTIHPSKQQGGQQRQGGQQGGGWGGNQGSYGQPQAQQQRPPAQQPSQGGPRQDADDPWLTPQRGGQQGRQQADYSDPPF